ncbi:MAG: Integrase catalytic region [Parcubacteria group bacterium GW2011_GWF2_43_11]|nr:MAG: Integrase catalytic region [Parcubacteria group bacterium GW2011_GWF2_43_11]
MDMAYSQNPNLPRVRMEAVELVKYHGWSARQAARRFGFSHCAVRLWLLRQPEYGRYGRLVIPTRSSRPLHHPDELSPEIINRVLELRSERQQCAEILHHRLKSEGILVSLSSVKRILKRNHCTRFSKWKKWHQYPVRPLAASPGALIELDSMLDGQPSDRLSAYALIDLYSRWAFAWPIGQPNSLLSARFIARAQETAPFKFQTVQSDHGSEFAKWFTKTIEHQGFVHRHSRVRTPTDNGHIERFIQTLQNDCLARIPRTMKSWQKEIPEFIRYYNYERPHMALNYQTPMQVVRSY